jgi:hypothetical protein
MTKNEVEKLVLWAEKRCTENGKVNYARMVGALTVMLETAVTKPDFFEKYYSEKLRVNS